MCLKRHIEYDIIEIISLTDRRDQYLHVGSAHRIAFSPLVTQNRYFRLDYPLSCLIVSKLLCRIAKLPAATSNLRETSVIICSQTIFPAALSSSPERRKGNVAAGLRKSRKSRIACGESQVRVREGESRTALFHERAVSETILLLKAAPNCFSRGLLAAREEEWQTADHTATEERLIKRAKTVFIKFICGNMRRLK